MKPSATALAVLGAALLVAALLVSGCGSSGGEGSSSSAPEGAATTKGGEPPEGGGADEGGAPKKATAPNAPAGSKVISCAEDRMETVGLRATAVDCGTARATMERWESSHACTLGKGHSHSSCSLDGFRCQAVRVDRGAAVSCGKAGADVAFIAKAWLLKKSGDD